MSIFCYMPTPGRVKWAICPYRKLLSIVIYISIYALKFDL